ncbi:hypothetical protein NLX83_37365 [Allokutzneria sp. A3M-2-11 16]|uniref:hypothetical protein n=1 Tax=Allokutzneria sp. A3M-2-11 16 TaxID=2962043 RepID=UPI0020B7B9BE|nr:hypothetical protein [Allokutzneria sp. A3M-2-11 16]MCP3804951.1 hypothetical protein [Allokutzneria sp. A3M-2-11 16]
MNSHPLDKPSTQSRLAEPVIDCQDSAARALFALFMSNVDAGDDSANDVLIEFMDQRRYRAPGHSAPGTAPGTAEA